MPSTNQSARAISNVRSSASAMPLPRSESPGNRVAATEGRPTPAARRDERAQHRALLEAARIRISRRMHAAAHLTDAERALLTSHISSFLRTRGPLRTAADFVAAAAGQATLELEAANRESTARGHGADADGDASAARPSTAGFAVDAAAVAAVLAQREAARSPAVRPDGPTATGSVGPATGTRRKSVAVLDGPAPSAASDSTAANATTAGGANGAIAFGHTADAVGAAIRGLVDGYFSRRGADASEPRDVPAASAASGAGNGTVPPPPTSDVNGASAAMTRGANGTRTGAANRASARTAGASYDGALHTRAVGTTAPTFGVATVQEALAVLEVTKARAAASRLLQRRVRDRNVFVALFVQQLQAQAAASRAALLAAVGPVPAMPAASPTAQPQAGAVATPAVPGSSVSGPPAVIAFEAAEAEERRREAAESAVIDLWLVSASAAIMTSDTVGADATPLFLAVLIEARDARRDALTQRALQLAQWRASPAFRDPAAQPPALWSDAPFGIPGAATALSRVPLFPDAAEVAAAATGAGSPARAVAASSTSPVAAAGDATRNGGLNNNATSAPQTAAAAEGALLVAFRWIDEFVSASASMAPVGGRPSGGPAGKIANISSTGESSAVPAPPATVTLTQPVFTFAEVGALRAPPLASSRVPLVTPDRRTARAAMLAVINGAVGRHVTRALQDAPARSAATAGDVDDDAGSSYDEATDSEATAAALRQREHQEAQRQRMAAEHDARRLRRVLGLPGPALVHAALQAAAAASAALESVAPGSPMGGRPTLPPFEELAAAGDAAYRRYRAAGMHRLALADAAYTADVARKRADRAARAKMANPRKLTQTQQRAAASTAPTSSPDIVVGAAASPQLPRWGDVASSSSSSSDSDSASDGSSAGDGAASTPREGGGAARAEGPDLLPGEDAWARQLLERRRRAAARHLASSAPEAYNENDCHAHSAFDGLIDAYVHAINAEEDAAADLDQQRRQRQTPRVTDVGAADAEEPEHAAALMYSSGEEEDELDAFEAAAGRGGDEVALPPAVAAAVQHTRFKVLLARERALQRLVAADPQMANSVALDVRALQAIDAAIASAATQGVAVLGRSRSLRGMTTGAVDGTANGAGGAGGGTGATAGTAATNALLQQPRTVETPESVDETYSRRAFSVADLDADLRRLRRHGLDMPRAARALARYQRAAARGFHDSTSSAGTSMRSVSSYSLGATRDDARYPMRARVTAMVQQIYEERAAERERRRKLAALKAQAQVQPPSVSRETHPLKLPPIASASPLEASGHAPNYADREAAALPNSAFGGFGAGDFGAVPTRTPRTPTARPVTAPSPDAASGVAAAAPVPPAEIAAVRLRDLLLASRAAKARRAKRDAAKRRAASTNASGARGLSASAPLSRGAANSSADSVDATALRRSTARSTLPAAVTQPSVLSLLH